MNEELKKDEINTDAEAEEKVNAEAKEAEEEAEAVDAADAPAEAAEEAHEVLQAHPLAGPDALAELVILEGDLDAQKGLISENDKIDDNRN